MERNGRRKSSVWNYFRLIDGNRSICNFCKLKFSSSTTTNLRKHLARKHPNLVDQKFVVKSPTKSGAQDISEAVSNLLTVAFEETVEETGTIEELIIFPSSSTPRNDTPQKTQYSLKRKFPNSRMDSKLMNLFCKDFQPFSIVEDEGFRKLVETLNSSYNLPTKKTIKNVLLPALYDQQLEDLKILYSTAEIGAVTLTTDCWTSSNNEQYMAVTSHFIDSNFQIKSNTLECLSLPESHTSEHLAEELKRVALEWGIEDNILLCVTDNNPKLSKAITEILKWTHFTCLAHTLNSTVKNAIEGSKVISSLLKKIKNVVSQFKHNSASAQKFVEVQKQVGLEPKKLILEDGNRWNSTFDMINRFDELEIPIRLALGLKNNEIEVITIEEWNLSNQIKKVLKPMKDLTEFITGKNYVTASSVIILINGIVGCYKRMKDDKDIDNTAKELVHTLIAELENRFPNLESSNTLTISTFLDPRYKNIMFSSSGTAELIKNHVINLVAQLIKSKSDDKEEEKKEIKRTEVKSDFLTLWGDFDKIVGSHKPATSFESRANVEVDRYLDQPLLHRSEDPLKWWEQYSYNFPNLKEIVAKTFATVITSIPSEHLFSKEGSILHERRSQITSDKIKKLVFLNGNSV